MFDTRHIVYCNVWKTVLTIVFSHNDKLCLWKMAPNVFPVLFVWNGTILHIYSWLIILTFSVYQNKYTCLWLHVSMHIFGQHYVLMQILSTFLRSCIYFSLTGTVKFIKQAQASFGFKSASTYRQMCFKRKNIWFFYISNTGQRQRKKIGFFKSRFFSDRPTGRPSYFNKNSGNRKFNW